MDYYFESTWNQAHKIHSKGIWLQFYGAFCSDTFVLVNKCGICSFNHLFLIFVWSLVHGNMFICKSKILKFLNDILISFFFFYFFRVTFVFAIAYLSGLHIHRMIYEYGEYTLDITRYLRIIWSRYFFLR